MSKNYTDQVLGHAAESDGIEEYDNPLPAWWLGLFYFSIGWGVVYFADYHLVNDRSQTGYYEAELADANTRWPQKAVASKVGDADAVAKGGEIYTQNCIGCHGPELKGGIGPDLTDATWIHGGTIEDITRTITNGVPEKGMVTWGPILGPEKIAQVAAFLHSKSTTGGGN